MEFSKKEFRELERQRKHRWNHIKRIGIPSVIFVGLAALFGWYIASLPSLSEDQIISRNGLHWHPELAIVINGQKQEIPANIGLGAVHNPIHTHDATGVIHLEFDGLATKNNLRLSQFFKVWGKKFSKECILDYCNGSTGTVKMLVSGKESAEFENYIMKDLDKIEIKYE